MMEELCDALDQTVLDIFLVLEDLNSAKEKLEEALKEGFFQMSRARYNIGVKRINADQIIDAEISCLRSVSVLEDAKDVLDPCGGESNKRLDPNLKVFKLECLNNVGKETDMELKNNISVNTELRKRGKTSHEEVSEKSVTETISDMSLSDKERDEVSGEIESEDKFVLTDPINLFGVLVPQSLRSSQGSFETAVSLSIDIANLQSHLSSLQKYYLCLKDKKNDLLIDKAT